MLLLSCSCSLYHKHAKPEIERERERGRRVQQQQLLGYSNSSIQEAADSSYLAAATAVLPNLVREREISGVT
jgi:hypothetical protein